MGERGEIALCNKNLTRPRNFLRNASGSYGRVGRARGNTQARSDEDVSSDSGSEAAGTAAGGGGGGAAASAAAFGKKRKAHKSKAE